MSRTRRAGVAAMFGYAQFALSFTTGIILVPFILERVGAEAYGLWLGFGELLAYSAMVDLGILTVLPWLLAEEDGRGDRDAMRGLLSGGLVLSLLAAVAFAALAVGMLAFAPRLTGVTSEQIAIVRGPFLFMVGATALSYPLRTFYVGLMGLQDFRFTGTLALVQSVLYAGLMVGLLLAGQGLWALAAASALPTLVAALASAVRLRRLAPDLLRGWRFPGWALVRRMGAQGFGSWTAALGWRMVAASSSVIVLSVAGPEAAVVYAMTAKLGDVLTQLSWQLPDAGLVGLAQLKGEGRVERLREVVVSLLRLTLLCSGAVACALLAFNPAFVTLWVGGERFGGLALNGLVAALSLSLSLGHGLFAAGATLGMRVQAGWAALAQGVLQLALAVLLQRWIGLPGVALAGAISALVVAYPSGVWMVERTTGMGHRALWREALGPWLVRGAALLALGAVVGWATLPRPWLAVALGAPLAALYLWTMRPLYAGLPLPARVRPWLMRAGLLPRHGYTAG